VPGEPALHCQVIKVTLDRLVNGDRLDGFQLSASLTGIQGSPWASATLRYVTAPS
jgi:hypothetical protein